MNDIKHKTQKLKSPKIARNDHTKYVEMQLKKVNVENKLWAKEFLIREQKNTSRLDERENDPEQVEPLCPLEKKIKRPRNMIKRPMNQYMLFQREVREQVRAEYPDESVTQITCRLGYLWRNLPLSEKAKWQARAKYVKQEHMRLHPEYRYNPQLAAERRQEYITELTERRNLYRIKPQSDAEEV
ncbi:uncharacterized protein [Procambarus clarkii]|uniref:uncharacterized protein n=1 Tax=Procambarus clarkii TaxID=6728 RepID=UPI003741E8FE